MNLPIPKRQEKKPESWQKEKLKLASRIVEQNDEIIRLLKEISEKTGECLHEN